MVRSLTRMLLVPLLGAAFFGLGATQARAAIIISPVTVGAAEGGNFRYTYTLTLATDSALQPPGVIVGDNAPGSPVGGIGDGFTFYDAFGYVAGSAAVTGILAVPGNSLISIQNVGLDFPGTDPLPPDNPAEPNISVSWLGGATPAIGVPPGGAPILLGTLTFLSTNPFDPGDPSATHAYAAASQQFVDQVQISNNVQQIPGPTDFVIPEPASLVLMACSAPAFLAFALRRRRRQEAQ